MNKIIKLLVLSAVFCQVSIVALAQSEDPFVGTWDLDKEASHFGGADVPENMSRTYADLGDGSFMYLVITVGADGTLGGSSATYRFDGAETPIASMTPGTQARISYRKLNARTVEYTVRVADVVTQIGAKTISPDGRVLQIAIQFPNAQGQSEGQGNQILVFHRRE